MELTNRFVEGKTDFSSYDDFAKNFKPKFPEDFNFAKDVVDYYAENNPEKQALLWCDDEGGEESFNFLQLSEQSKRLANGISKLGIKKGDVVMLVLHRRYEYWFFILALNRIGAVALPVPAQMLKNDLQYRISESNVKMIAASSSSFVNQIEEVVQKNNSTILVSVNFKRDGWIEYESLKNTSSGQDFSQTVFCGGKDPMIMYYTSGTTGEPKLVLHNCLYPLYHIITAKYWQCVIPEGLHYSVAETGWAKTSWGKMYGQWIAGSAVFVYDRQSFNPHSMLEKISKYKVTTFCAPPTIYRYLVECDLQKYDLSSLKHCCSAGDALDPHILNSFYEKTGLYIYEGYGQTETALLAANFSFAKNPQLPLPNSIGKFSPVYDIKILDENGRACDYEEQGEIVVDSHHTGDLAYTAKNGFVYFAGRKDNIIKSSGFRISPLEVEKTLLLYPAVLECVVVGEADEKRGKIIKAYVVLKDEFSPSKTLELELLDFMRTQTALYKCPRKIEFVKSLPKTYNGKIKR